MVILHVKRGDQSLFLFDTTTADKINDIVDALVFIHNGKLKIERLSYEIEYLSKHGVCLPPNMQGLAKEQILELNLKDDWASKNLTLSDYVECSDPIGKRNGFAPSEKYSEILLKTSAEAKTRVSQKLIQSGVCLSSTDVKDSLDILKGAVQICFPMGLPSYETVAMELFGEEDLTGTQASKEILMVNETDLWWANKQLDKNKILGDYIGKNEKSKVIVKLQKRGHGPPLRESVLTEQQKKDLMMAEYRRREELKKLEEDDDDTHLNSQWADNQQLKKTFLGLNSIKFK